MVGTLPRTMEKLDPVLRLPVEGTDALTPIHLETERLIDAASQSQEVHLASLRAPVGMPPMSPAPAATMPPSPVTLADVLEFQQKENSPHTDLTSKLESLRGEHALLEAEHSRILELGEAALIQRESLLSEVESKSAEVDLIQQRVEWYAEKAKDLVVV